MSPILCEPAVPVALATFTPPNEKVSQQIWRLLAGMYPSGTLLERRQEQRYPYPRLITLSPVGPDGQTPIGPSLAVAGKHLSERGLGFFHPQPLSQRLVIVSLEAPEGGWLGFLLDIRRCRFTQQGWYESGGRFVGVVESPLDRLAIHQTPREQPPFPHVGAD